MSRHTLKKQKKITLSQKIHHTEKKNSQHSDNSQNSKKKTLYAQHYSQTKLKHNSITFSQSSPSALVLKFMLSFLGKTFSICVNNSFKSASGQYSPTASDDSSCFSNSTSLTGGSTSLALSFLDFLFFCFGWKISFSDESVSSVLISTVCDFFAFFEILRVSGKQIGVLIKV